MPTTRSAGQERAASIASQPTPVPMSRKAPGCQRCAEVWSLRRQRIDAANDQARHLVLGLEDDGVC